MIRHKLFILFYFFYGSKAGIILNSTHPTRRIIQGKQVGETRPYMVYLRPAPAELKDHDPNWLCGGVIIHERYILTSAACIEDVKHFYVVSGTHRWIPPTEDDDCIKYGKKRAIWKCEPSSYFFDGADFDNIRWLSNDLAVVKTEDDFNFSRKVKGCDFVPKKIAFNNITQEKENAGTTASIAGWGTTERFGDPYTVLRSTENSAELLETDVVLINKKNCKKRWAPRYHEIIDANMICAKDAMESDTMPPSCAGDVNCKDLQYSEEEIVEDVAKVRKRSRRIFDPNTTVVHTHTHNSSRRAKGLNTGGFCENDHGGPLVIGHGATAMVIGVISACQTHEVSNKCFGPYLFSSVWKNRHLLTCAIDKEKWGETCRRLMQTSNTQMSETSFDWSSHPDGPAKAVEKLPAFGTKPENIKKEKGAHTL